MTEVALLFGLAFVCEFIDSSLGMGYGTTLTPLLILIGYNPLVIVPVILLSELFTGASAAFAHSRAGNVKFDFRNTPENKIAKKLGKLGYMPRSNDSRIALVLALCSIVGAVGATIVAVSISTVLLKWFIGIIVTAMGVIILVRHKNHFKFSWKKITGIGALAAFNKGLSGGGYGPLVTGGQILSGVSTKSAVAITSMSESFTCLIAIVAYLIGGASIDLRLAASLMVGALASVPLSAIAVKKMKLDKFTFWVGVMTTLLGLFTIYKLL